MPNHVAEYLVDITGNDADKFWNIATKNNNEFKYQNVYPSTEENWYDFNLMIYGNKRGRYDVEIINIIFNDITILYSTAWDKSDPFWINVTKDYDIKVIKVYHDEGSNFCGETTYYKGTKKKELYFKNYKKEEAVFVKYADKCGRTGWYDD